MMTQSLKSPLVALLLSFIPGMGHLYIGRVLRFLVYALGSFGPILLLLMITISSGRMDEEAFVILGGFSFLIFIINMLDMFITISKGNHKAFMKNPIIQPDGSIGYDPLAMIEQQEKSKIMLLSIIPGLGHMYMGLIKRGITLMILFVANFAVVLFIASIIGSPNFLLLWLAMPVIWVYSMFDAMELVKKRQQGFELLDTSIFTNVEAHLSSGIKSRTTAMLLSIFPGAGHLYIGQQQRGLQFMGLFLMSIFVMDQLQLSLFLFLLPLLWCYAFFDVITQMRNTDDKEVDDKPIIVKFAPYQRWIGIGLLIIGLYYVIDKVMLFVIKELSPEIARYYYEIKYMLPTAVTAFILILLGIKLVFGTSRKAQYKEGR